MRPTEGGERKSSLPNDGGDASVRDIGPRYYFYFVVWLALAALPATPRAQTFSTTAGMPVRIELVGFCNVSASDLDFGAYASNQSTPAQGQTVIQLLCSGGTVAELSLDAGSGPGGNTSRRRMEQDAGSDRLDYDLFQDPGRTIHWGDRSGVDTLEVETSGAPQTIPVYGQVPGGQRVRDGIYSDTITVHVRF
jgi:spore coat protein U domain-containing protein, fimbrial subunit CupE1/2/3/6